MRKAYIFLVALALIALSLSAVAQKNGSIKGVAFDTLSKQVVASATVSILDKKDSSLVSFTMTDNKGFFELNGIPAGQYRLLLSHVNYHNSNTFFTISDSSDKNLQLGNIALSDKNKVLPEVIVTNEDPPITLIGDTVQYNANSFKTQPNANVEQLLKKLPGVKVDKDGTITAQGEKVNRVLVDGKEFFSNDPKIATRNLPADAIDKVQVYDKQSEQAQLTGFEDGNYEKTINLKLKKDKKKGVFGKVTAGAGNKKRYEGRFNVNSFKGARQISAIGMGNNTNAEGFSFMDMLSFSGALNQLKQGGGGGGNQAVTLSANDAAALGIGGSGNNGINTTWGGGLNYNNIIGKKLDWQSSYFYNRFNPSSQSHIFRQNIFKTGSTFNDEYKYYNNLNNSHRLNLNLLYQIDSFHSIRIIPSLNVQDSRTRSRTDYRTFRENGNTINDGFSDNLSNSDGYSFKNDLIFRKKFRRKGRTLSLSLQTSINASDGDGNLSSVIGYYDLAGSLLYRDTINQQSFTESDLRGYSVRAVYTEPLWKSSLLELSAGKSRTKSISDKSTYDFNTISKKYDLLNEQLSNDFENMYGYTNAGVRFRTQKARYNYSFGATWQIAELEGKITSGIKDSTITKEFRNILPNATFKYNISKFRNLTFNYSTNTNQPSMSQLQPVPDITNPLYIRDGNPDLKQEYSHSFRAGLNLLSPYKNKNFFFFLNATTTNNKIVNYDSVNLSTGVRRTRPINVDGVYRFNGTISYSMPVRFLKGTLEVRSIANYDNGKQFINSVANTIKTFTVGPEVRIDMNPNDKVNFGVSANYNYNKSKYSLQSALNTNYLSQEYNTSVDWQLPQNFFLSTDFAYTINSRRAAGFNGKIAIWNASISKQFLKYNRGEIKFSAYDLLNNNVRITRTSNQNYIEDKEVNSLRRFFLFSFTYSLSKSGLNNASGGFKMIMR